MKFKNNKNNIIDMFTYIETKSKKKQKKSKYIKCKQKKRRKLVQNIYRFEKLY